MQLALKLYGTGAVKIRKMRGDDRKKIRKEGRTTSSRCQKLKKPIHFNTVFDVKLVSI